MYSTTIYKYSLKVNGMRSSVNFDFKNTSKFTQKWPDGSLNNYHMVFTVQAVFSGLKIHTEMKIKMVIAFQGQSGQQVS